MVSGQFGHPSLKNPTWVHQNHPVAAALRARHGVDLCFAGVVISPEPVAMAAKEDISAAAARVCADAGFDAVIVTKEGGGNADADMALKMDALEDLGITAVGLFAEMSGIDGTGPPIVVAPGAGHGHGEHRQLRPPARRCRRWSGPTAASGWRWSTSRPPTSMELPTAVIYCSLSCLGWGRLTGTRMSRR